jgi:tetratricopeptide (TPR) repeat protein
MNVEWLEVALAASRKTENQNAEGAHLGNLGNAYAALGQPVKAIEYYEQALKISRVIGDRRGEGDHLFNMSLSLNNLDQRAKAIDLAKSALKIYEQIESPYAERVQKKIDAWQK